MSFFRKLFRKKTDNTSQQKDDNSHVYFANAYEERINNAMKEARKTFGYFVREYAWEQRRIVPALNVASVKVKCTQTIDGMPNVEHMWLSDIYFDGEKIIGTLLNEPMHLSNIKQGDIVTQDLDQISDWLFAIDDKTYGGFTVQALRSTMPDSELKEHDQAWGLDFGDFNEILIAYEQKEHPEYLINHPMDVNTEENFATFFKENPEEVHSVDEEGYSHLHRFSIQGNLIAVKILLSLGADHQLKTPAGKTALDFAQALNWQHIIPVLQNYTPTEDVAKQVN